MVNKKPKYEDTLKLPLLQSWPLENCATGFEAKICITISKQTNFEPCFCVHINKVRSLNYVKMLNPDYYYYYYYYYYDISDVGVSPALHVVGFTVY
jgi:hypothetical protein